MGKTNPLNDDDLAEFVELQKTFADSPKSRNRMGMMRSRGMKKLINPILPINPIRKIPTARSSHLAVTIKHCCRIRKQRSCTTSRSDLPISFYPEATARLIR